MTACGFLETSSSGKSRPSVDPYSKGLSILNRVFTVVPLNHMFHEYLCLVGIRYS